MTQQPQPSERQPGDDAPLGGRAVVWISDGRAEICTRCSAEISRGSFIAVDRVRGIRCVSCEGLADLVYLPAGDVALTRRAVGLSARAAIVVKFSRARRRNERQGVLIEQEALEGARAACEVDAGRRGRERMARQARDEIADREYVARFAEALREQFPGCPGDDAQAIARHACRKYSGRVGRSAAAKALEPGAVGLAVRAHVRHRHSRYDELLADGVETADARRLIRDEIEAVLARWRSGRDAEASRRARRPERRDPR